MDLILQIILFAVPILYAITLHEVAHGWVAKQLGDNTATSLGRLSLNPVKHVDPIGTILVPAVLFHFFNAPFGWAKPVPVNWNNLHNPKQDMAWVALAGPAANLLMLLFWGLALKLADSLGGDWWDVGQFLISMANIGIWINLVIMFLNLLPIPPLDGSRVVYSLLPGSWAMMYARIEPVGIAIVLLLFASGYLFSILSPIVIGFHDLVFKLLAL